MGQFLTLTNGGSYGNYLWHYLGLVVVLGFYCRDTVKGGDTHGGNDYFAHCLCTDTGLISLLMARCVSIILILWDV